jgi:hypothetical protein
MKLGTHPALITMEEAEQIIARLETYSLTRPRRRDADYLLTGLLKTADGKLLVGQQSRYYRAGTRHIAAREVDATVLERIAADLRSRTFATRILERVRENAGREPFSEARKLKNGAKTIERQISRLLDVAVDAATPAPVLRKVNELERSRVQMEKDAAELLLEAERARAAKSMTEAQVFEHLDELARGMEKLDRQRLKDFLHTVLEGITINPGETTLQVHYRIALRSRFKVASPRVEDPKTYGRLTTYARLMKAA